MLTPKELKKLVATCRKLGVSEFTSPELSFKLTQEVPILRAPRSHKSMLPITSDTDTPKVDTLSDEAILFWSTTDLTEGLQ